MGYLCSAFMNMDNQNSRPLIAHLSMSGACAGWGLMAPVGKDAMTHGIDGITMVTFRVVGACLLFLDSLAIRAKGGSAHEGQTDVYRSCTHGTGIQSMLLHHRPEHHLAYQCLNCHHVDAYLRNAVVSLNPEGADNR